MAKLIVQQAPKITEKAFQQRVEQALRLAGWVSYHTWISIRSARGFPDLLALHEKKQRMIAIEVKTDTGKVTPEQQQWLELFDKCGVETWVLRPGIFDVFWEKIKP